MPLPSWASDEVTVWRAPLVESRRTEVRDWANATSHTIAGCSVQPASTASSFNDPRASDVIRATLYAPPNSDLLAGDKVEFDGNAYSVDGQPQTWRSPFGRATHMVANLIDWRG